MIPCLSVAFFNSNGPEFIITFIITHTFVIVVLIPVIIVILNPIAILVSFVVVIPIFSCYCYSYCYSCSFFVVIVTLLLLLFNNGLRLQITLVHSDLRYNRCLWYLCCIYYSLCRPANVNAHGMSLYSREYAFPILFMSRHIIIPRHLELIFQECGSSKSQRAIVLIILFEWNNVDATRRIE